LPYIEILPFFKEILYNQAMFFKEAENSCPFRIDRTTIQEFNQIKIDPRMIPGEGVCSVSIDRKSPCLYSLGIQFCQLRIRQDFCDKPWVSSKEKPF